MVTEEGTIPIRSFRVCFELERRLHKIDNWRVPLPYGLPLRSVGYFGAALFAVVLLGEVPLCGALLGVLHPVLRYFLLPAGAAAALTRMRIDGRSPVAAGLAWLRMRAEPSRVSAFRAAPGPRRVELGPVTIAPDERGSRLRLGTVEGPAQVVLRYPAELRPRGRTLRVTPDGCSPLWRGKQINLREGERLVVG